MSFKFSLGNLCGFCAAVALMFSSFDLQAQYPSVIDMTDFKPYHGSRLFKFGGSGYFPKSVSEIGDFNGDGIHDVFLGYLNENASPPEPGMGYVVFGSANPDFTTIVDSLNGTNGFSITGISPLDGTGISVANAGDVNGDGRDDLLIGALQDPIGLPSQMGPGQAYVLFGAATYPANINLSSLNGTNGFSITGVDNGDQCGYSVSGAGDVNNDGIDDILVGSNGPGETYVVYGTIAGFPANLDVSTLNGSNGFTIYGTAGAIKIGTSVSAAGDMNGDGIDDLAVGAPSLITDFLNFSAPGGAAIVFGSSSFTDSLNIAQLNGSNGFLFIGRTSGDQAGDAVRLVGDVNGDGRSDLLIGASEADVNFLDAAGEAYLVLGATSFPDTFLVSALNGSNGTIFQGIYEYGHTGLYLSGQVDLNQDGRDDMLFNLGGGFSQSEAAAVFGAANFPASFSLDLLNGTNGFRARSYGSAYLGSGLAGLGDVNNDGLDDFALAAPGQNSCYILHGSTCWPTPGLEYADLCDTLISQSGNQVWTTYGSYLDTIPNSYGCDSIIEVSVNQISVDTFVSSINDYLYVDNSGSTAFQWLDCNNANQPIAGATSDTYTPTQSGSYAVMVTSQGCTQTSGCHTVILTDRAPASLQSQLSVSPNPTSGSMFLDFGSKPLPVTLEWFSADGKRVESRQVRGTSGRIDITPEHSGLFFLKVTSKTETAVFKLLRQ